jgi:solute:Na+ symporter, SSS family
MLGPIDVTIIIVSMLFVIGVGAFAGRKRGDTAHGYFLGGNKMPWWLIGTAFVATGISSEQMIGTVGVTYEHGMGIANWEWFGLPGYTLVLLFFIPIYLRNKVATVPGFLADRFGPAVGTAYSSLLLFLYVFVYMSMVLYAGGLAFSQAFFGEDPTRWQTILVLLLIAVGVGAYTIHGGLTSVMWADLFQCILLMVGGITLFLVALHQIPPDAETGTRWGALVAGAKAAGVPERMHLYQSPGHPMAPFLGMIIATFGAFTFYQVGNQSMIQRMLAARSTWDALMGLVLAQFINFFRPLVTCFLGLVVWHWIHVMHKAPEMADQLAKKTDLAFNFALRQDFVPTGVRGVVLAGLIAAVMAVLSGLVNSTSTMFSTDLYKKFINKGASDRQMVRVGRTASFLALLIAACVSPIVGELGGVFKFFQNALTYIACPFMATVLMGILWKRVNYAAGLFGLIGGFFIEVTLGILFSGYIAPMTVIKNAAGDPVSLTLDLAHPYIPYLHFFYVGGIGEVIIIIGMVIVTLVTSPPDYSKISRFIWSPKLLQAYDEGVRRPWFKQVKFWYGVMAAVWFSIYWYFW